MKSRDVTQVVGITALTVLAISPPLYAWDEGDGRCSEAKIITFDAPHAGKGPGAVDCYNSCPGTEPYNVNVWGAVTGYVVEDTNQYHGFVRSPDGTITDFDAPGASPLPGFGTVAYSINAQGKIAGQYEDASSVFHGYVRSPNGTFDTFDAPGAGTGAGQGTIPLNINDVGEVTGFYIDANSVFNAFLRPLHGPIIEFEAPGAGTGAFPRDNNGGAGWTSYQCAGRGQRALP